MYVKEECSREDRGGTRPESGRAPRFESRRFRAFEGFVSEFVQICGWPSPCGRSPHPWSLPDTRRAARVGAAATAAAAGALECGDSNCSL